MDSITTVPLVMRGVTCYGQYHNNATHYDEWRVMDCVTIMPLIMTGVACCGQYHNIATRYDKSGVFRTVSQQCHSL